MGEGGASGLKPKWVDDEFSGVQDKGTGQPPRWGPWLALHVALGAVYVLVLSAAVPRFEVIFADFGVTLPPLTRGLVQASHAVVRHVRPSALALSLIIGLDLGVFVALSSSRFHSGATTTWGLAGSIALMAGLAGVVVAMLVPLTDLIHRLSG